MTRGDDDAHAARSEDALYAVLACDDVAFTNRTRGRGVHSWAPIHRSASRAAMHPVPAAVTAWR